MNGDTDGEMDGDMNGDTPTKSSPLAADTSAAPSSPPAAKHSPKNAASAVSGHVDATTFHRLCARAQRLIDGARLAVPKEKQAAARFWIDDAPLVLLEALESSLLQRYDAVVVDEGQDFAPSWWDVLEDCLRKEPRAVGSAGQAGQSGQAGLASPPTASLARRRFHDRMVVFYDPSQVIFGRPAQLPDFPLFRLTLNFRNTRQIAQVVQTLGDVEMVPAERCPDGPLPEVHSEPSAPKLKRLIGELLRHLIKKENIATDQVVILTPHSRKNSFLKGEESVGDFPLVDTLAERRGQPGSVLHTTIAAFKGLESDVIICVHADPADPRCSRNARYVAFSRARHVLHVYGRKNPLQP
jgi:hypothetical protein